MVAKPQNDSDEGYQVFISKPIKEAPKWPQTVAFLQFPRFLRIRIMQKSFTNSL